MKETELFQYYITFVVCGTLFFYYKQLRSGPSTESCLVKPEIPVLKVA